MTPSSLTVYLFLYLILPFLDYHRQILKQPYNSQSLHVVFYYDDKQIKILASTAYRQRFTTVTAENPSFEIAKIPIRCGKGCIAVIFIFIGGGVDCSTSKMVEILVNIPTNNHTQYRVALLHKN